MAQPPRPTHPTARANAAKPSPAPSSSPASSSTPTDTPEHPAPEQPAQEQPAQEQPASPIAGNAQRFIGTLIHELADQVTRNVLDSLMAGFGISATTLRDICNHHLSGCETE